MMTDLALYLAGVLSSDGSDSGGHGQVMETAALNKRYTVPAWSFCSNALQFWCILRGMLSTKPRAQGQVGVVKPFWLIYFWCSVAWHHSGLMSPESVSVGSRHPVKKWQNFTLGLQCRRIHGGGRVGL